MTKNPGRTKDNELRHRNTPKQLVLSKGRSRKTRGCPAWFLFRLRNLIVSLSCHPVDQDTLFLQSPESRQCIFPTPVKSVPISSALPSCSSFAPPIHQPFSLETAIVKLDCGSKVNHLGIDAPGAGTQKKAPTLCRKSCSTPISSESKKEVTLPVSLLQILFHPRLWRPLIVKLDFCPIVNHLSINGVQRCVHRTKGLEIPG